MMQIALTKNHRYFYGVLPVTGSGAPEKREVTGFLIWVTVLCFAVGNWVTSIYELMEV